MSDELYPGMSFYFQIYAVFIWLTNPTLPAKSTFLLIFSCFVYYYLFYFFPALMYKSYGVEPPVLVKLEKEIELEETMLMESGPLAPTMIAKSCCHHELHEAVRCCHTVYSILV